MALSGTIKGTTSNQYIESKIVWSATQSIENNTSTVKATLYYKRNNVGYKTFGTLESTITIGSNSKKFSKYVTITESGWTQAATYTATITHKEDGTSRIKIAATGAIDSSTSSLTSTKCSATVSLNTINRKATILTAPNFNDEGNPTITYSNPAGTRATTLQACISLTGAKDDIAYRDISKSGTSYTFYLTDAERKVLRQATTDANSRKVKFFIKSVVSGYQAYSSIEKTFSIVNANPTINPTIIDTNAATVALTGNNNTFINGFSNASITFGAAAKKEASIVSQKVVNGSKERMGNGAINAVNSGTFELTVVDSRKNSTTQTVEKTFIPYYKPTIFIENTLPATDGTFNFKVKGKCFWGSFGAQSNTGAAYYRYKLEGEEYGEWAPMILSIEKNEINYYAAVAVVGLDYRASYTFQAYIQDSLTTTYSIEKTVRTIPVFDWSKDDFNINGTLSIDETVALRHNQDYKSVVLSAENSTIHLRPNGTFDNYGETILDSNGNLSIEGNLSVGGYITAGEAISNKVLWEGSNYMTAEQTINLSSPISEQQSGIVLVFSRYSNGAAENANFNFFYVPKYYITAHEGAGTAFQMGTVNFSVMCCKYLYINDTNIKGNDLNSSTGTGSSGIKYENNAYVLRYVVGV